MRRPLHCGSYIRSLQELELELLQRQMINSYSDSDYHDCVIGFYSESRLLLQLRRLSGGCRCANVATVVTVVPVVVVVRLWWRLCACGGCCVPVVVVVCLWRLLCACGGCCVPVAAVVCLWRLLCACGCCGDCGGWGASRLQSSHDRRRRGGTSLQTITAA